MGEKEATIPPLVAAEFSGIFNLYASQEYYMQCATVPNLGGPGISEGPVHSSGPDGLGYTLWRYDGEQWKIKKDCPVEGAVASPPPTVPGEFEGQLRATSCVAAN